MVANALGAVAVTEGMQERSVPRNEAIKEEIVFSLNEQMIEDFKHTEMMYAGVNHRKYNIKTKEIALSTVKSLAEDFK